MHFVTNTVLSSIGAIFATQSVPGTILFEQSSSTNFNIVSCTPETVTVITDNYDAALEPGHILAYMDGGSDSTCAEECNALFRKITSRKDKNAFYTELVTFADIFPSSVYDDSVADTFIEPMFQCYDKEERRFLADTDDGTNDDTGTSSDSFCTGAAYIAIFACLCGLALGPCGVPCCIIAIIFLSLLYDQNTCGDVGNRIPALALVLTRRLDDQAITPAREQIRYNLFPTHPEEWTKTDAAGNCLYTSCNIGKEDDDASNCFRCSTASCEHEVSNRMVYFPTSSANKFDFTKALRSQEMCYSSNFDKALCDEFFFKTMNDSCPIQQQPFNGMLPLTELDLSQNCDMVAVLFYLSMKGFGNHAYVKLQSEQHKYENDVCESMVPTAPSVVKDN